MIVKKINKICKDKVYRFEIFNQLGLFKSYSDKVFLKKQYEIRLQKELNLDKPETFNEKMQWLKINNRKENYIQMVDKYQVRSVVEDIIGKEYLVPLLGVYSNFDEIDFDKLPNKFVIKTTHDSGGVFVCEDKSELNKITLKKSINRSLKRNYYYHSREWPYKFVKPKIIIEQYLENDTNGLYDYKVWCFNGKARYIQFISGRKMKPKEVFFDTEWNMQNFTYLNPQYDKYVKKPEKLKDIITLSEKLSENIPFLRVDFYILQNKIYFGELTFYPNSGMTKWNPENIDNLLGKQVSITRGE